MGVWPRKRPLILHIVLLSQASCRMVCVCVCVHVCVRRIEYIKKKKSNGQPGTSGRVVGETNRNICLCHRTAQKLIGSQRQKTQEPVNPNIDRLRFEMQSFLSPSR